MNPKPSHSTLFGLSLNPLEQWMSVIWMVFASFSCKTAGVAVTGASARRPGCAGVFRRREPLWRVEPNLFGGQERWIARGCANLPLSHAPRIILTTLLGHRALRRCWVGD